MAESTPSWIRTLLKAVLWAALGVLGVAALLLFLLLANLLVLHVPLSTR